MMLDAVEQAMQMAGYDTNDFDRNRTGVCVGAVSSGEYHESLQMGLRLPEFKDRLANALRTVGVAEDQIESVAANYQEALIAHMPSIIDETGSYTTNTLVSRITKAYNLMGGGAAIDSGSTSGSSALTTSVNILQAGDCEMMICTAGQRAMGMPAYELHALKGQLAQNSDRSPFDAQSNGYFPGEGAGAVVLKRLSDALRDGNKVYGVIRGFGVASSDSFREAMQSAIQRCHDHAGVRPDAVNIVESAARGNHEVDAQEVAALATVYGQTPRTERVAVGSTTSQIGHVTVERSRISHPKAHVVAFTADAHSHRGHSVVEGVVHQIAQTQLEPIGIGSQGEVIGRVELHIGFPYDRKHQIPQRRQLA